MATPTSALGKVRTFEALDEKTTEHLRRALAESGDTTIFVNGTALQIPKDAHDALIEVLSRFAAGDSVTIGTAELLLNTSQAAQMAGISNSYLRKLADSGIIPVEYRGTHRRIRPSAIQAWLDSRENPSPKGD
ncbi:helix-turn-helix domain-containing protein [Glutamicibacter protophormiae]|uniref:helix-turn-helix domain-containing protein n=1 Tax=Glutamicibacter protophormiae TaxID=37930 RepID=UPI00195C7409|nr:helix-turn-helix domain-containing protein [Glutamicibacter protophormiae]QRQ78088.1 helix-turn-helix domain-containing protein [Glutamicibacter protophormiae]